jgi:serine protease Do
MRGDGMDLTERRFTVAPQWVRTAAAALLLLGAPALGTPVTKLAAQGSQGARGSASAGQASRAPVRGRAVVAVPNSCQELRTSPSPLTNAPEGLALLRLRRELESAALTIEQQRQLERDQLQRMLRLQRGMDSAIQVVVRHQGDGGEMSVTLRRSDSVRTEARGHEGRAFEGRGTGGALTFTIMDSVFRVAVPSMDSALRFLVPTSDSVMRRLTGSALPQMVQMIRALQPQVAALTGEAEALLPSSVSSPSGYMGLSLSGSQLRMVTPDGVMTSHCEYPLVETVDAGSPAARAGLNAGDTLVAYNGRDVLQLAVNYPAMLTPGSTVAVRVRRSGRTREVPVAVAARADGRTMVFERVAGAPALAGTVAGAAPGPAAVPLLGGAGVMVLAGAQFATVDDEFLQGLGLEPGVLVLRVPTGTPAYDAGLRGGDVVRAVNGAPVRDAATLRQRLQGQRDARLLVQGKGSGARTVVLRIR